MLPMAKDLKWGPKPRPLSYDSRTCSVICQIIYVLTYELGALILGPNLEALSGRLVGLPPGPALRK